MTQEQMDSLIIGDTYSYEAGRIRIVIGFNMQKYNPNFVHKIIIYDLKDKKIHDVDANKDSWTMCVLI